MSQYDFDLFVIGAGSGGVRAARIAAGHGAKVAICESHQVGGTCVIRGCVPKKLMSYAAHVRDEIDEATGFGWNISSSQFDWNTLVKNRNAEINRLNGIYLKLLSNAGVQLFEGHGKFINAHTISVDGTLFTADKILIAVGGQPAIPEIPGIESATTSNDCFYYPQLPKKLLVVGGGYISVEFASIFNGMGSQVTLSYRGNQILRGFDPDIRNHLAQEMIKKGVDIRVHHELTHLEKHTDGHYTASFNDGQQEDFDQILLATGRTPSTDGLDLEKCGVVTGEHQEVLVDHESRTNVKNIFAVGDVTDRNNLTPVAIKEGHAFADNFFGTKKWFADHEGIPSAIFSHPPVGTVGLNETEARTCCKNIHVYLSEFRPMKHTLSGSDEKSMMKLIVDTDTDQVIGVHMVGQDSPEIIQGFGVALKCGATKQHFDTTIGIHPTAAEEFVTMREPVRS
ncbi:MAG: glutathione-disulfide reductase [bacterium]